MGLSGHGVGGAGLVGMGVSHRGPSLRGRTDAGHTRTPAVSRAATQPRPPSTWTWAWNTLCRAVGAGVGHEPVAAARPLLAGDRRGQPPRRPRARGRACGERREVGVVRLGTTSTCVGRLRVEVAEGQRALGLGDDVGGDLPRDDPAEQAVLARVGSCPSSGVPHRAGSVATRHRPVPTRPRAQRLGSVVGPTAPIRSRRQGAGRCRESRREEPGAGASTDAAAVAASASTTASTGSVSDRPRRSGLGGGSRAPSGCAARPPARPRRSAAQEQAPCERLTSRQRRQGGPARATPQGEHPRVRGVAQATAARLAVVTASATSR